MSVIDSAVKLVVGDLDDKRAYRQLMDRADALPEDYRYAFRKIRTYMYTVGGTEGNADMFSDLSLFASLVELFEASAAEGKHVLDVTGEDVAGFADAFVLDVKQWTDIYRGRLNRAVNDKVKKQSVQ